MLCLNFPPFISSSHESTTESPSSLDLPSLCVCLLGALLLSVSSRITRLPQLVLVNWRDEKDDSSSESRIQINWRYSLLHTNLLVLMSVFSSCLGSLRSTNTEQPTMTSSKRNKKSPSLQRGRPIEFRTRKQKLLLVQRGRDSRGRKVKRSQRKFPIVILINKLVIGLA